MSAKVSTFAAVTDERLADMAREYAQALQTNTNIKSDYLRIMVARAQHVATDGKRKRSPTPSQAKKIVGLVHERMYAVVLQAVTTPDLVENKELPAIERSRRALERNRRSNFARTAKYALEAWLDAGGKLMGLDANEVTREYLRSGSTGSDGRSAEGLARSIDRTGARLLKIAEDLVRKDSAAAEEVVSALMAKLGELVAKPLTKRPVKRGELTSHPTH